MARMRLIKKAAAELREADPNTAVTENALRSMAKRGEVCTVKVGNKYLINMDLLEAYLSTPTVIPTEPVHTSGIRPIPEK